VRTAPAVRTPSSPRPGQGYNPPGLPQYSIGIQEGQGVGLFDAFRNIFGNTDRLDVPADDAELPFTERRQRPRRDARKGTRVLIIDDSRTIGVALRRMLQPAGFVTMEALDAETGLELARSRRPELVFLDIVLPGMNGFAALRALRKDPQTHGLPVIMMSGNEQATEQFFGSRIGADDFMKKPFSRQEVFARIEKLLDENAAPHRPGLRGRPTAVPAPVYDLPGKQNAATP
jgi:twitching motility two-component system response regulator PilH